METPSRFSPFVGRLIRVVYNDGGDVKAKVGKLLSADSQFVEFETYEHRYIIRVDQIQKLQDAEGKP